MATATKLLTAAEFARLPNEGVVRELVRGEVVVSNQPYSRHGQVCVNVCYLMKRHLESSPLGHVVANDSGIITNRNPDTVRGGDVWYVSYEKVPRGPLPQGYLGVSPDIVFEVISPSERRSRIVTKVGEYLEVGIPVVCVLDPEHETATLFYQDHEEVLSGDDPLTFPNQLPGFKVPVSRFFE